MKCYLSHPRSIMVAFKVGCENSYIPRTSSTVIYDGCSNTEAWVSWVQKGQYASIGWYSHSFTPILGRYTLLFSTLVFHLQSNSSLLIFSRSGGHLQKNVSTLKLVLVIQYSKCVIMIYIFSWKLCLFICL